MQMDQWTRVVAAVVLGGVLLLLNPGHVLALQVGDQASDFPLPATTAEKVSLADYLGKKSVVLFFYLWAFNPVWTQEALAFQLDLHKFEAAGAQVLGVSVDENEANKAWAKMMGITYPLLSDTRRQMAKAYGVLYDDPKLVEDPATIRRYIRAKRAWFVIDKGGVIRFVKTTEPTVLVPNDELLKVLRELK
jgi:peroxiredoxin